MVGQQDQFVGNILFHNYLLSKRNPTFLSRNLAKVLELHRQELETSPLLAQSHNPFPAVSRAPWTFPSNVSLRKMIEDDNNGRALVLQIKGIEPWKPGQPHRGQPTRKKGPLFKLEVGVQITLFEQQSLDTYKLPEANASLLGIHSENGKHVSLDMPKSIIKLTDLFQAQESSWKTSDVSDWEVMVNLNLRGTQDAEEFYMHMAAPDSFLQEDLPTRLRMRWSNIQDLPVGDKVQSLTVGKHEVGFGLKFSIYWSSTTGDSILTRHNQRLSRSRRGPQYPTPPPQRPTPINAKFEITYEFAHDIWVSHGLQCPSSPCSRKNYSSLDDLRMHLESAHSLIQYGLSKEREADGVQYWTFKCEVADFRAEYQRASNAAPDPREISYVAPRSLYNQQDFLEESNRGRKTKRTNEQRTLSAVSRVKRPPKHPDEVQQRILLERRTFPVPKAPPDVTFFRSISKRPLQEGEYISESDDEVEMDWVQQRKDAQITTEVNLSEATKRLLLVFDPFMREERLHGDYHMADALVRFSRAKASLLWRDGIFDEFKVKLASLLEENIISEQIHDACINIVEDVDRTSISESGHQTGVPLSIALNRLNRTMRPTRVNKGKGRATLTDMGQITPQTAVSDGDAEMRDASADMGSEEPIINASSYELCLCGEDALASLSRPSITCESIVSLSPWNSS
jgi:hypothetical protein